MLSDTEAILELGENANVMRIKVNMAALEYWLGQKVQLTCRTATHDEINHARRRDEEEYRQSQSGNQDERLFRMMKDIHKLAASPHEELLRIPTFSGAMPTPNKEATFAQ